MKNLSRQGAESTTRSARPFTMKT
ncbi:hypothetical protein KGM_209459 [Danaus plexippus plexippus]|uniref:Uncharacterized protein n=1 Tax=Danaus plexippus plexippus TaxID=278856 RepID=A0A212F689_DANPL|nr:hypothetical protein KGM_209459 [Danaus plexippus plexippus]